MTKNLVSKWLVRENAPNLYLNISENEKSQKTIVFIPGLGWHAGFYYECMRHLLNNNIRVVVGDLRGHGQSRGASGLYRYDELVQDVIDVISFTIKKYGENVYLLGTSTGAFAAYSAAIKVKEIKGLILNSAWDINNLPPTICKKRMVAMIEKFSKEPEKMLPLHTIIGFKKIWYLLDNKFRLLSLITDEFCYTRLSVQFLHTFFEYKPVLQDIEEFQVPTFVIKGEKDVIIPTSHVNEVFEKLSPSRKELAIIKNGGHLLMLEHFDKVIPIIKKWIDEN